MHYHSGVKYTIRLPRAYESGASWFEDQFQKEYPGCQTSIDITDDLEDPELARYENTERLSDEVGQALAQGAGGFLHSIARRWRIEQKMQHPTD